MVTDATPESLSLSWTVPEGRFDHFLVQYKNGDGQPKALRVPGHQHRATISGLEPDHKYKMNVFGFHGGQRVGPVSAIGATGEWAGEAPGRAHREHPLSLGLGEWGAGAPLVLASMWGSLRTEGRACGSCAGGCAGPPAHPETPTR